MLQLHKELYKYSNNSNAGKYKLIDNVIEETNELGKRVIRIKTVSAFETKIAIEDLCNSYNNEIFKGLIDSLFLIPVFIIDLLLFHPFMDGMIL